MKVRIIVYDGADELDFVGPYEVLDSAAKLGKDVDVALVTLQPQAEITAAHGMRIRPHGVLEGQVDLVVVPGGGWAARAARGVRAEIERGEMIARITALHQDGATVAGVCTGAMALAAAGLLDGRAAVTHHGAVADLRATTARVIEARVVDDGDIITCGGVTSSLDLALWVVERFWGAETANTIARALEYSRSADIHAPGRR
jgi:transcriptional regulator GlxA family with amidase domain